MFVQQGFLLEPTPERQPLPTGDVSPFQEGARSADQALQTLKLNGVQINLAGLRWFQNVGLIEKPAKDGRNAVYPQTTLDEIASMRTLQVLYGRSVDDLLRLRERRIRFTETLRHLLRLEADVLGELSRQGVDDAWQQGLVRLSLAGEFFDRVLEGGVHPSRLKRRVVRRLVFFRSRPANK